LLGNSDIQGRYPLKPLKEKYNSKKLYLVLQTRYSRGIVSFENF